MRIPRLTLAGLALVAAHFLFVAAFHEPAVSGPDAGGYFAQAKMLATQAQTYQEPASPLQFVGPHWIDGGGGRYYSKYPPGFPLLLAVPYALFGPTASLWVDPLLASATLLGLFLLCRLWIGPGWALAATALMATNPLVNQHAVPGFSHTAVAFFLVWGMYALARWRPDGSSRWLTLAGLCVGMVPATRYAEILYAGAFALYVGLHLHRSDRSWRAALPGLAGAALPMALLALRNQLAFGAFWRTGYAISGEQTGFGFAYFAQHWASYLDALGGGGVGLLFGLGVVGMAVLVSAPDTRLRGQLLVALVVPTTLLYMAYYWGGDGMSQRFLLPTYYLYAIAGVWLLKLLAHHLGRPALVAVGAVLVLALPWGLDRSVRQLAVQESRNRILVAVTDSLERHVPAGAILLADRSLGQHLDVVGPWRIGHAEVLLGISERARSAMVDGRLGEDLGRREERGAAGAGSARGRSRKDFGDADRGDRPNPMAGGARQRLDKYRGLSAREREEAVLADLKAWAGAEEPVYLLGPEERLPEWLDALDIGWKKVALIQLPQPETGAGPAGRSAPMASRRLGGRRFMRPGMMRPGMPGGGPFGAAPGGPVLLVRLSLSGVSAGNSLYGD